MTKTIAGKLFFSICLLSALLMIVLPIYGLIYNDFVGYFAFSLFPVAILIDFLILLSYLVKNGTTEIMKKIWVGLYILIIIAVMITSRSESGNIVLVIAIYIIWLLTFPTGIIGFYFPAIIFQAFESLKPYSVIETPINSSITYFIIIVFSFFIFLLGYFQWFKLIDFLITKWQARRK